MDYEETAAIIEMEIENFDNLDKFEHFIDSTTFYHLRQFQNNFCTNCTFTDSMTDVYIEDFYNTGENAISNLKNICRKHFGNFFSLILFLKCLAALEEEEQSYVLNAWNVNENNIFFDYCLIMYIQL